MNCVLSSPSLAVGTARGVWAPCVSSSGDERFLQTVSKAAQLSAARSEGIAYVHGMDRRRKRSSYFGLYQMKVVETGDGGGLKHLEQHSSRAGDR